MKVEVVVQLWLAAAESASKKNAGGCASVLEKQYDCKHFANIIAPISCNSYLIATLKATRSFLLVLLWLYSRLWKASERACVERKLSLVLLYASSLSSLHDQLRSER